MNKKGFTLIELLAVIVVLGIIMTIAGTAALKIKKNADIETAKKLEKTIEDLGPSIYSYEMIKKGTFYNNYNGLHSAGNVDLSTKTVNDRKEYQGYSLLVTLDILKSKGYLKTDQLKIGNNTCQGFLRTYKTDNGPYFEGNICCAGIYSTNKGKEAIGDDCSWYIKSNEKVYNSSGNEVTGIENYTPSNGESKQNQGWVTELSE